MKLDIQNIVKGITTAREVIGAKLINWSPDFNWNDVFMKRLNRGNEIEDVDSNDLYFCENGTLEFAGKKVIVYIRDRKLFHGSELKLPKFHVANCETLQEAVREGEFDKYVVSTRTDGKFKIRGIHYPSGNITDFVKELDVCINCIIELKRHGIKFSSINNFFEQTGIVRPKYSDNTAPINYYPTYWRTISRQLKRINYFTCEECEEDLAEKPNFLQVHHKNKIKYDNRPENLAVLCLDCHSKQGWDHEHIKSTPEYKKFIDFMNMKAYKQRGCPIYQNTN